jgi:sulfatase modifying factor 1
MKLNQLATLIVAVFSCASTEAITIPTVPIGNPANVADTRYLDTYHTNGVGAVAQAFNMGATEVTNAQYVALLNAVAASDPYGLYSTSMGSKTWGGIVRSGESGSYTYDVKAPALGGTYAYDSKPVAFVGLGDAMRFANWLNNGQPIGAEDATTTENGAYTLNGAITDAALAAATRNSNATWWLPSENEWYKAAYYDPSTGAYFDFPTRTNTAPNNNLPSADTGNSSNFYRSYQNWTTGNSSYPFTGAGAYALSESPYGTFDQGGNAWELNDTLLGGSFRDMRGGSWDNFSDSMHASLWSEDVPSSGDINIGFRVASIPEPASAYVGTLGIAMFLLRIRRRWQPSSLLF